MKISMHNISGPQLLGHIKKRCENDFKFFVRYFFKSMKCIKFNFSHHHDVICDALVDVYYGRTSNLLINVPPGCSKSELCIVLFSAWCYVKNSRCRFLHISYSDNLTLRNSRGVKDILRSVEFRQLWPNIEINKKKSSDEEWETNAKDGGFRCASSGGQITGYRGGYVGDFQEDNGFGGAILIDDPMKPDDVYSTVKRERINMRWHDTFKSRFGGPHTPCIVIMQRLHEDDFSAMLKAQSEYKFKHIVFPAIIDKETENERSIWPFKLPLEKLHAMEASEGSYMFAAQMQQNPSPMGGGIIKGSWFGTYTVLPPLKYRAVFIDTAQKKGQHNDYQVFLCAGIGIDGYLYIIDVLREKFEGYELEVRAPDFWNKHKVLKNGQLRFMAVEDKVSGTDLIQKIRNKITPKIPVREIPRGPGANKLTRLMDVQGYIEAGYVKLPANAPWKSDYIREHESFTANDTHLNDDQVDVTVDAIKEMLHQKTPALEDWM